MSKKNILSKISKMSEEELKDLARSTSDVETLNILAENENYEVRIEVAANENTSVDVLAMLAKDEDIDVRRAVVNNPNTSYNTLLLLSKVKALEIREKAKEVLKERTMKANTNKER